MAKFYIKKNCKNTFIDGRTFGKIIRSCNKGNFVQGGNPEYQKQYAVKHISYENWFFCLVTFQHNNNPHYIILPRRPDSSEKIKIKKCEKNENFNKQNKINSNNHYDYSNNLCIYTNDEYSSECSNI